MKKAVITILSIFLALLLIAGVGLGGYLILKYSPSKEVIKDTDWFGVEGDQVAILYQNELQDAVGLYVDNQVYLPLDWVIEHLNGRFYWDTANEQLIYTLPDSIVYANLETIGNNGVNLIRTSGSQVYLMTGIIAAYTNVQMDPFLESDAKRIYLDDRWQDSQTAKVTKDSAVRQTGGIKSAILTSLPKDGSVTVIETYESWSKVKTTDGFLGYIENKRLDNYNTEPQLSTFEAPIYTNISLDEEICMVWHQVTIADANSSMEQLVATTKGVNVIAPTWFMLTDNQGGYDSLASKSYVDKAHQMGLQVWAALDNFNRGDNVQSEILFASTEARKRLITDLMAEVLAYGIDGINLDVEGIKPEAGPHYVQFIRELSIECRREGIVLSVDTYVPSSYTSFYNRPEQGIVVDYVVIMAYDEHYAGSDMGSVSSIDYVTTGIEDTLKDVPKEKLICGLPFYTRLWQEEDGTVTSKALGMNGSAAWIDENDVELYWQEELGQYYGEKTDDSKKYAIWMEETESMARKISAVREQELAGAAYWKLGLESEEIWDVIKP